MLELINLVPRSHSGLVVEDLGTRLRTDRTKDTELSWIQLRVEKMCKTENISIAKFLYRKVKRWLQRKQIFLNSFERNFSLKVRKYVNFSWK